MPKKKGGMEWFKPKSAEQKEKERRNKEAAGKMAKALLAAAPAAVAGTAGVGAVGYETLTTLAGSNPTIERAFPDLKNHRTLTEAGIEAWEDRTSVQEQTQVALRLAAELGVQHATARDREFNTDSFWGMDFIPLPNEFSDKTVSTEQGLGSIIDVVSNELVDSWSIDEFKKQVYEAYLESYNRTLGGLFIGDIDLVHAAADRILDEDTRLNEFGRAQAPMLSAADFYSESNTRMHQLSDQYRGLETFDDLTNAEYQYYVQQYTERLRANLYEVSLANAGVITEVPITRYARDFKFSDEAQRMLSRGETVLLTGGLLFEPIFSEVGVLERISVQVVPVSRTNESTGESEVSLVPFQLVSPISVDYDHGITRGPVATEEQTVSYMGGYDFSQFTLMNSTGGGVRPLLIAPEGTDNFPVWQKTGEGAADLSGVNPVMLEQVSYALIGTFTELRADGITVVPVITSGVDTASQRVRDTAHADGLALDIRVNQFDEATQERIRNMIGARLPAGYTVILETSSTERGARHNHIHIEYEGPELVDTITTGQVDSIEGGARVISTGLRGNRW